MTGREVCVNVGGAGMRGGPPLPDSGRMRPDARAWFEHRTTSATSLAEIDVDALLLAKRRGGHRVSVVLPVLGIIVFAVGLTVQRRERARVSAVS